MLLIKDKRPSLNTQTDSIHVLIALLFIRFFFFFFFSFSLFIQQAQEPMTVSDI